MLDSPREAVGFLCRWTILALAGLAVAGVGYVGILGSANAWAEPTRVIPVDYAWSQRGEFEMRAYLQPPVAQSSHTRLMAAPDGHGPLTGPVVGGFFILPLYRAQPGTFDVNIKGQPYGPMAYVQQWARLAIVQPQQRVLLVDAATAMAMSTRERELLESRAKAAGGFELIVLDGALPPDYEQDRSTLRHLGWTQPVVNLTDPGRSMGKGQPKLAALGETARRLERQPKAVTLVTADRELAAGAAAAGFVVEAVASGGRGK